MLVQPLFQNRAEAGRVLAKRLRPRIKSNNVIVLALPRGGVPVGFEVAQALHAELDIFLVRKLGVPGHEELAMARFIRNIHKETCEMVVLTRAAVFHVPRTTCVFPRSRAELLS